MEQKDKIDFQSGAADAAELLKKMSNPHRLLILCSLMNDELSVSELNERIDLSQSALSQHLASLRQANLVTTRKEKQTVLYQLNSNEVIQIISTLHSIYCAE
ncbi:hypothetical protein LCGC14_0881930 [marine sediment metagenome]|uniref:HTH arsR-type domain-containing protein n=1 Tax=marine sediment metagenome TaxID=412755 RepID=A0A0F9P6K6_9ZZZZ|nr:ArsR family transcriptional regulator [Methylophaga aminisulfidivorans]